MAITIATVFTDLGKLFSSFCSLNGTAGVQAPLNYYKFTCSSAAATIGATYTNSGTTYTVLATIAAGTILFCSGNSAPGASGTLTKATGTGDATITYSAVAASGTWGTAGPIVKAQDQMTTDILTRLQGAGLTTLIAFGNWQDTIQNGIDTSLQSQKSVLQELSQQVVIKRVNNDVPQQSSTDLTQALQELIRQMQDQSKNVAACTVSATVAAGASNTGTATVYASVIDHNGLTLEYALPETMILKCTDDQFSGGVAGSETISLTSPAASSSPLSYTWPDGSGLSTTLTVVDPEQGNGSGVNLLTGSLTLNDVGAFKAFTSAIPDGWTIDVDAANIADGTTEKYAGGDHCLKITGNTAGTNLNTALYQSFANPNAGVAVATGSTMTIEPNTVYHFYGKVKADVVPAAGALQFSLTDGAGTVLNNNAGTANTITSTISGFGGTTYQTVTGSFQTPTIMPTTGVRLRIKASTKITTGSIVYVDYVALSIPETEGYGGLYAGGPFVSAFRGAVDLINWVSPTIGDFWTVAVANNFGSTSPTPLSFNVLFEQLFSMSSKGLILPSSGSGTETNSLIS